MVSDCLLGIGIPKCNSDVLANEPRFAVDYNGSDLSEFLILKNAYRLILFHSYYPFSVFVLVFSSCLPGCHIDKVGAVRQIEHRAPERVFGIFLVQRLYSFAKFGGLLSLLLIKSSYIALHHLPP